MKSFIIWFFILNFAILPIWSIQENSSIEQLLEQSKNTRKAEIAIELAEKAYQRSITEKKDKFELEAILQLGILHRKNRQYEVAKKKLLKGVGKSRKYPDLEVEFYYELGEVNIDLIAFEEAVEHLKKALQLWEKQNKLKNVAGVYKEIGYIYWQTGKITDAEQNFQKSLEIFQNLGEKSEEASLYNNLGNIDYQKGNYDFAFEKYMQSLLIRETINDSVRAALSKMNIGNIFIKQKKYDKALDTFLELATFYPSVNQKKLLLVYNSIGVCYRNLGENQKALAAYHKVLEIGERLEDYSVYPKTLSNIGYLYYTQDKYEQALQYYQKSLQYYQKIDNINGIASSYLYIGVLKKDGKQPEEAIQLFKKALKQAKTVQDVSLIGKIYKNLSECYEMLDDIDNAFFHYKKYIVINDSLNSVESKKNIEDLNLKYETEKKEQEINILTKNNEIQSLRLKQQQVNQKMYAGLALFLVVLASGIYLFKQNELKRQKKVEQEITRLNQQLEQRVQAELKRREHQQQMLIQKSKLESLGKLAAGIAHELNQPLSGISMGLENIYFAHTEKRLTETYLDDKLQVIDGYFERIRQIIEHVRIFSRDQKTTNFENVNVNEVIKNALSLVQTQYRNHNVTLQTQLAENLGYIQGNKFKLEQVILNLLTNAKDAITEKGNSLEYDKEIQIKTFQKESKIIIEIMDNGIGIKEETVKNIFDPFFTTKDPAKGTGLGLSISYGIVQDMFGEIRVESKENEFTKFIIEFEKI